MNAHKDDIQLERYFLAMVRNREHYDKIRGTVSEVYFSSPERARAFAVVEANFEANPILERVTLPRLVDGKVSSEEAAAINLDPHEIDRDALELSLYLADRSARRRLLEQARRYHNCEIGFEEVRSVIEDIEGDATATKPMPLETGDQWMVDGAARFNARGRKATGFEELDRYFRYSPGNVYVVTADTGRGKSLLAHELAFGYTRTHDEFGGIIGLEMDRDEVAARWINGRTVEEASRIHHPNRTSWTPAGAIREITRRAKNDGVKFWVLDHFMLFSKDSERQNQTEFETQTARALERCAKATGTIIVIVGQYNKAGAQNSESKTTPSMHNLKGSKALADIAAGVLIIDHDEDPGNMSGLYLAKNRFGVANVHVGCWFDWSRMLVRFVKFEPMARTAKPKADFTKKGKA